ncbi:uncharacterized protein LOC123670056 [Melitaea cinxia]|uniref:uncharacterized protein LOC123670056 n=1 Tax=Melitaea cinxia TaxID=113334 RepID=UPI001E272710|nr:uncharacterized protein LOC123670056 [Melitaea cinxia]
MKTAVTVLQELMIKNGQLPQYECISQSGPQHQVTFEYRCTAQGIMVTGQARSKKEAKQEAARRMLTRLHTLGTLVPPPFATPPSPPPPSPPLPGPAPALDARSYVALLKELCEEYRLGAPAYELVGDTGPPHARRFTVRARLRLHERVATATTKKAARQLVAQSLYTYLRENLARLTKDFVEEEALARAHEKRAQEKRAAAGAGGAGAGGAGAGAAGSGAGADTAEALRRYAELSESTPWRHDLGQRVADYHLGLLTHIDEELRALGAQALTATERESPERALQAVSAALGLRVERPALCGAAVVRLVPTAPLLAFAGRDPDAAAAAALRHLRRALRLHSAGAALAAN